MKVQKHNFKRLDKEQITDEYISDVCSRIPYRPMMTNGQTVGILVGMMDRNNLILHLPVEDDNVVIKVVPIEDWNLVLFPISELQLSEMEELIDITIDGEDNAPGDWIKFRQDNDIEFITYRRSYKDLVKFFDWMYKHNYDVHNFCDKGMALKINHKDLEDNG
jgi:hypothetical protein